MKIRFLHYIICVSIVGLFILGGVMTVYAIEGPPQLAPFNFEDFTDDRPSSGASPRPADTGTKTPAPSEPSGAEDVAAGLPAPSGTTPEASRAVADNDESLSNNALAESEEGEGGSAAPPDNLPGTGTSLVVLAALSGAGAYIVRRFQNK